jgi:growth factor-regulated tyrosine kinase substrate
MSSQSKISKYQVLYPVYNFHNQILHTLAQLRDAREALDALREDHREKRRREMEELERQRQIQMAHKLDIMRQKKHVVSSLVSCIQFS